MGLAASAVAKELCKLQAERTKLKDGRLTLQGFGFRVSFGLRGLGFGFLTARDSALRGSESFFACAFCQFG
jgi:hypothetical protein